MKDVQNETHYRGGRGFGSSEAVSKTGCFCITEWGGDSASHPLFQNDQKTAIPKKHEVISHFPHQGSEDEMTPLIMISRDETKILAPICKFCSLGHFNES